MKIEALDRHTVKHVVRPGLQNVVDQLEEGLGLKAVVGNAVFEKNTVTFKVTLNVTDVNGVAFDQEADNFTRMAGQYGLNPEALGKTFTSNGVTYTILGLNPKARTYPIQVRRNYDAKKFKYSATTVALTHGKDGG